METPSIFWFVLLGSSLRYIVFAGSAYSIFYIWKKKNWYRFKIQQRFPKSAAIKTELLYSFITIFIFAAVIYVFVFSPERKYTLIYKDIHDHTAGYFIFTILFAVFLHDTWFYWTHRVMHWKKIFPFVHAVHHKSHNPTPLAAFSFHPVEAIIEIGIVPLLVFIMPIHPFAFSIFGLYMITMNVTGHLGYELFPEKFIKGKLSRFMNTSTHHNMHHHYSRNNYGLYFNIWDRLMKTNHSRYEEEFINVTQRAHKRSENEKPGEVKQALLSIIHNSKNKNNQF